MAAVRAKQIRNKLENQQTRTRKEIAELLSQNKEEKARIQAEQCIQQNSMEQVLDILETQCNLLETRMMHLESEPECPSDLLCTVCSVIYCQPRVGIQELGEVKKQFERKYGKQFVTAALDNQNQAVHYKVVQLLQVRPPHETDVIVLLQSVAQQYRIAWDPPTDVRISDVRVFAAGPPADGRVPGQEDGCAVPPLVGFHGAVVS